MALRRFFTGFENGNHTAYGSASGNVGVIQDGDARSGTCSFRIRRGTAASSALNFVLSIPGYTGSVAAGKVGECSMRFYLKVGAFPSANNALVAYLPGGTGQFGIVMDTTGHIAASGNGNVGSYSATALTLNTWVKVLYSLTLSNSASALSDSYTVSVTVDGLGTMTQTQSGITLTSGAMTTPTLGMTSTISTTAYWTYDDVVVYVDDDLSTPGSLPALPTSTRVTLAQVSGQGTEAGWTGAWYSAKANLAVGTGDPKLSATSASLNQSFFHETAATLGLSAIQAVRVYAACAFGGATTPSFRYGGASVAPDNGTTFTALVTDGVQPVYADWTAYTAVAFDAIEWGWQSVHASSNDLYALWGEVLHEGTARPVGNLAQPDGTDYYDSYSHAFGTYTGDGTAYRAITGIGFRPHLIRVWCNTGTTSENMGALKHRWMAGSESLQLGGTALSTNKGNQSNGILSLDADGFTIGAPNSVNKNATTYVYLAVRDGGNPDSVSDSGFFFKCGSYLGANGTDNADIRIPDAGSWQPDVLQVFGGSSATWLWRTPSMVGDLSADTSVVVANKIQAMNSTGFQIGTSTTVQNGTARFTYVAWRIGADLLKHQLYGSFTGSASDVTVTPGATALQQASVLSVFGSNVGYFKDASLHSGTTSQRFDTGTSTTTLENLTATTFRANGGSVICVNAQTSYWQAYSAYVVLPSISLPEIIFTPGQSFGPILWAEFDSTDGTVQVISPVALPDPSTYYHGFKAAKVLSGGRVIRALSDEDGQYESQHFSVAMEDTSRYMRGLLGSSATLLIYNKRFVIRMIDEASWRLRDTPRTVAIGLIRNYQAM